MTDTSEIPVWDDCPWSLHLPSWIEIRRGLADGREVIVLWNEEHQIGCDAPAEGFQQASLGPMIGVIGGAIFEKEHPGQMVSAPGKPSLPRRMAEAVIKQGYPNRADLKLHQRLHELTTIPAGVAATVS